MLRFMMRALLLGLILSISTVTAQAQYGRYGGWGGWGGGVGSLQGSMMRGAGVASAGAGVYNQDTAVARSINANTAMQVNQYMYEVNKNNAKHFYAESAAKQKEESSTGESIYKRLHDNPSGYDIHTGDALNVVMDELTNPDIYTKVIKGANQSIDGELVRNIQFEYAANMIAISLADLTERGAARLPAHHSGLRGGSRGPEGPRGQGPRGDRQHKAGVTRDAGQMSGHHQSPERQGGWPPGADAPNRLDSDNYLKALFGLTKMIETPSVEQYLHELKTASKTDLGHLICFMHTFNLRFGASKTPVQEATYDQIYPMLVALRDQANAPSANPYTTSSGPKDPKAFSAYFSQMQYDQKHGVVPPPPPAPGQP